MNQPFPSNESPFQGLRELIATLRGENGCPWDRKQTPESMRVYLVEEMYELLDALESDEPSAALEELGDVLFHVFFLSCMFEERGEFTAMDVAKANTEKMIARHPHVFGDDQAKTAEEVRARWHQFKKNQQKPKPEKRLLDAVPKSMPALMRAYRIIERASRVGVDRPPMGAGVDALDQKWAGLRQAFDSGDKETISEKLGPFLLELSGLSRQAGVHPENCLTRAANEFCRCFSHAEEELKEAGKDLEDVNPEEINRIIKKYEEEKP
ncbi:tetrapyrrole methylase family protein / MazG family protein [Desulfatibacillum alkenivorans DSM 16219]|uniref:Tetrapyrrole methylase family protein / MazG family protein n=1 Tax=Desulfatibacillum alkenivorans DSM 16219 TaxID=1121393 RepID=A0A1M6JLD3_9BACT|nr:nucleoside triphosphate pyrophosphohydrolase [Desulfatibacillum alkenivorans]SHJ47434.1 tetrapyrrole methylase family protein / MazG family protein [Desulfatibacillum alkenivorans DSM 16219]